jgi:DNA-binding transcriptional LysR family regulator
MNYTLHQLRVFAKIAELESITKASEALFLTQPAVSIQLKKFQEQFEIPLTEVIGRKLYVSDFGREIVESAKRILAEANAIENKTLAFKGHLTGQLKLSIVSTAKYVMPYFLSDFIKKNEGVDLIMDVTNKARVINSLEKNEVDFSLVSVLPENLKVERVELMQNTLYLVGNKDKVFDKKVYTNKVFDDLPMIFREQGSATRKAMEHYIAEHNLPIRKKMELTSNEAVKQAVLAGLGYSIMPLIGIKNELQRGDLQVIPVRGFPITTHWNLIWLKGKRLSPAAEAYLKDLKERKNDIMHTKFDWFEQFTLKK